MTIIVLQRCNPVLHPHPTPKQQQQKKKLTNIFCHTMLAESERLSFGRECTQMTSWPALNGLCHAQKLLEHTRHTNANPLESNRIPDNTFYLFTGGKGLGWASTFAQTHKPSLIAYFVSRTFLHVPNWGCVSSRYFNTLFDLVLMFGGYI